MPLGSETVVIICRAVIVIVTVVVVLCCGVPESVTLKRNGVAVNGDVGVPLMTPVAEFSVNPGGMIPVGNCQVYGVTPPVAVSVVEHGPPATQLRETGGAVSWGMIVSVKDTDAVCGSALESDALKASGVAVTGDVGVPLIPPVMEFRVNPEGSVPAVKCQVYGAVPPAAARVCA
jgi:hypothetical protein